MGSAAGSAVGSPRGDPPPEHDGNERDDPEREEYNVLTRFTVGRPPAQFNI